MFQKDGFQSVDRRGSRVDAVEAFHRKLGPPFSDGLRCVHADVCSNREQRSAVVWLPGDVSPAAQSAQPRRLRRAEKRRAELTDAIDFCEEIKEENLGEFDPQYYLKKMDEKEIHDLLWNKVKEVNKQLTSYKAIKYMEIKKDEFIKTTTMKIKRYEELKNNK